MDAKREIDFTDAKSVETTLGMLEKAFTGSKEIPTMNVLNIAHRAIIVLAKEIEELKSQHVMIR